jgi:hypothetical protein
MAEIRTEERAYKSFELSSSAYPLSGDRGFIATVVVRRSRPGGVDEARPKMENVVHDTAEDALEQGFAVGRSWVDSYLWFMAVP